MIHNSGRNPVWNFEVEMAYSGELGLNFVVMDHDVTRDEPIGRAHLQLSSFAHGFEGAIAIFPGEEGASGFPASKKRAQKGKTAGSDRRTGQVGRLTIRITWVEGGGGVLGAQE